MFEGRCLDIACSKSLTEVPVVALASVSAVFSVGTPGGLDSAVGIAGLALVVE